MSASAVTSPTSPTIPQRSGTVATRTSTGLSDDEAITEDTSEVTRLFIERLQAWKHACGYIEDYVGSIEKLHLSQAKDYEKVLKTVSNPLRESHHFDERDQGIAGFFEALRANTQGISNSYSETAKALKGSVLPTFERLHAEIKAKNKELQKGAGKGTKLVEKARQATQKHVEMLGQHTAASGIPGAKIQPNEDPYILRRGILYRLNRQIQEENAQRNDILQVQNNFATFESHVVQTIQSGLGQLNTIISKQADTTKSLYGAAVAAGQRVPADFEWMGFLHRNQAVLIDESAPARSIETTDFPNSGHQSTVPLISGSLERRGKIMRRYDTNYYVVTQSKYLHEFKTDDDFARDPVPEMSLYLPDCVVGMVDGEKFDIKGKDVSKGKLGNNLSMTHTLQFKAHTARDAQQWWEIVRTAAGKHTMDKPELSLPNSPVAATSAEGEKFGSITPPNQANGSVAEAAHATPAAAAPAAATTAPSAADEKAALAAKEAAQKEEAHAAGLWQPPATGPVATSAGPAEGVSTLPAKS